MSKGKWLLIMILSTALAASFLLLPSCNRKAAQCPLCERDIHKGMAVKILHNGHSMRTCCMACALTYKIQTENVEVQSVTDYLSEESIDATKAVYVVGSDISPCIQDPKVQKFLREPHGALHACYDRCDPGILAFSDRLKAQQFQKDHGGLIRNFEQLPSFIAVKDGAHHDQ